MLCGMSLHSSSWALCISVPKRGMFKGVYPMGLTRDFALAGFFSCECGADTKAWDVHRGYETRGIGLRNGWNGCNGQSECVLYSQNMFMNFFFVFSEYAHELLLILFSCFCSLELYSEILAVRFVCYTGHGIFLGLGLSLHVH